MNILSLPTTPEPMMELTKLKHADIMEYLASLVVFGEEIKAIPGSSLT